MHTVLSGLSRLFRSRRGQGVVEYGLILMLIVIVVILTALGVISDNVSEPVNETAGVLAGG